MEDFDLALDLLLFDGFEDFDDAFLVVDDVEAFEDFGVFAAAWLNCVSGLLLLDISTAVRDIWFRLGESYRSCARPRSSPARPS